MTREKKKKKKTLFPLDGECANVFCPDYPPFGLRTELVPNWPLGFRLSFLQERTIFIE
jgi:hypothetical protein